MDVDCLDFSWYAFHFAYWSTGAGLFVTKLQIAVQVDVAAFPGELKHSEREHVGQSQSIPLCHHSLVLWVGTSV